MKKILAVSLVLLFVAGTAAAVCNLEVLDEFIPPGDENVPYSHQMSAYGGSGSYTWSIWSGSLPAGLSMNSSGLISGTPTAAGYTLVYIRVTDTADPSCTNTRAFFFYIN